MTLECPAQFFFACNTTDLVIMVGLIIILLVMVIVFAIFLYLRGKFGGLFYHSDKLQIALQFENEGAITGHVLKDFGALKMVTSGPEKGSFIIPRPNSAFKSPNTPTILPVLGRGIGLATNPFVAEYVRRIGGAWPKWSGQPPPKKPRDLRQLYQMYAEWKAGAESKDSDDRSRYIMGRMAELDVPQALQPDEVEQWTKARREDFGKEYDEGAWGPFTVMAGKLKNPELPDGERFGIYQALNSEMQSEPAELWPTWIAGHSVDIRDLSRFTEELLSSEIESAMNRVQRALASDQKNALMKVAMIVLLFFGVAVSFAIVYSVLIK
jgi:hypothetical protein